MAMAGIGGGDGIHEKPKFGTGVNEGNAFLELLLNAPKVARVLLKYLPKSEIHKLRRLTPALWANFETDVLKFGFNEAKKTKEEQRMNHILYDSLLKPINFVFQNVKFDLDEEPNPGGFIGNQPYFDTFMTHYAPTLKALHLVKCQIKMGGFFRLIAGLTAIEELHLIECDPLQLFIAGFEILPYAHYMRPAKANLAKLKHCVFRDMPPKELYKLGGVNMLIGATTRLESLDLFVSIPEPLPHDFVANVFQANRNSLRELDLTSFEFGRELLELMMSIKLIKLVELNLSQCTISCGDMFGTFLSHQLQLQRIKFQAMELPPKCFQGVETLPKLCHIKFQYCKMEEGVLAPFANCGQLVSCHLDVSINSTPEVARFFKAINPANNVKRLTFRSSADNAAASLWDIARNMKGLKYLDVSGLKIMDDATLSQIWWLTELEELYMKGCEFEGNFFVAEDKKKPIGDDDDGMLEQLMQQELPSIANLSKSLKILDMSNTSVNDDVIDQELMFLNVEQLNLSNTPISRKGLKSLADLMHSLLVVDIRGCHRAQWELNHKPLFMTAVLLQDDPSPPPSQIQSSVPSYIS